MTDVDHAPDCALVLYAGLNPDKPQICDCEASDGDAPQAVEHDVDPRERQDAAPAGPVVTLTGGAARAFTEYQRIVRENRKREGLLLAKLTEELAR